MGLEACIRYIQSCMRMHKDGIAFGSRDHGGLAMKLMRIMDERSLLPENAIIYCEGTPFGELVLQGSRSTFVGCETKEIDADLMKMHNRGTDIMVSASDEKVMEHGHSLTVEALSLRVPLANEAWANIMFKAIKKGKYPILCCGATHLLLTNIACTTIPPHWPGGLTDRLFLRSGCRVGYLILTTSHENRAGKMIRYHSTDKGVIGDSEALVVPDEVADMKF